MMSWHYHSEKGIGQIFYSNCCLEQSNLQKENPQVKAKLCSMVLNVTIQFCNLSKKKLNSDFLRTKDFFLCLYVAWAKHNVNCP